MRTEIENWMLMAVQYPCGLITESFYLNKHLKQFFAVAVFDYLLFDENFQPVTGMSSNIPESEIPLLGQRIQLIEAKDSSIVRIPLISFSERKELMQSFVLKIDDQLMESRLSSQLHVDDNVSKFKFEFLADINDDLAMEWLRLKNERSFEFIAGFCNQNQLDLKDFDVYLLPEKGHVTF